MNDMFDAVSAEYTYSHDRDVDGLTWKVYTKECWENAVLLHPETFLPIKPFDAVKVERRIGIAGERVREFPSLVVPGQKVKGYNWEEVQDQKALRPTANSITLQIIELTT